MKNFSIKEALKFGWLKTKENLWFLIGLQIIVYIVNVLVDDSLFILGTLISIFTGFVLSWAFFRLAHDEKINFKNLFAEFSFERFLHYLVVSIIVGVLVCLGFIFLIIPGIIIMTMTSFAQFVILEKNAKLSWKKFAPWEAVKTSAQITKGVRWKVFLVILVSLGVNILGVVAFGVGLLITVPLTAIAIISVYKKLKSHTHSEVKAEVVN